MRVVRARWTKAVGKCHNDGNPGDHCRLYSREWVDVCLFDEGFLLGFEAGWEAAKDNPPSPTSAVRMVLTPGQPKDKS